MPTLLEGGSNNSLEKLGAFKNSLGILSDDGRRIRPRRLMEVTGLGAVEITHFVNKSRPQIYRDEILVSPELLKRFRALVMVTDIVFALLNQDINETRKWMMIPNTVVFGDSPFEVCMRGDAEPLIEWLRTRAPQ